MWHETGRNMLASSCYRNPPVLGRITRIYDVSVEYSHDLKANWKGSAPCQAATANGRPYGNRVGTDYWLHYG